MLSGSCTRDSIMASRRARFLMLSSDSASATMVMATIYKQNSAKLGSYSLDAREQWIRT